MARPRKIPKATESDFMKMARAYGVSDNALLLSALETYSLQRTVLESVRAATENEDPTIEKEYVKGRRNLYIHPGVRELPRHVDSANKTAALILSIIKELGAPLAQGGDEFDDF